MLRIGSRLNSLLKNPFTWLRHFAAAEAGTDFSALAAPLKRYPDTNREFFSKL
jgi:hypothetical protein